MARLVMKFGGTSVADVARIHAVAERVAATVAQGQAVAVVVSAMARVTNELVALTRSVAPLHDAREYDAVAATGEQVSAALLAMALQSLGISARSWLGWQIPIRTSGAHGSARIQRIDTRELETRLARGEVPVVAGFQGLGPRGRITTLGRGGSDTTAVALAAVLGAERCDIYTDVDGVYTADPRIVPGARKLDKVTFEEMMELASSGAKVLQIRSVELAMNYRVRVQVLSSFGDAPGTLIVDEGEIVEKQVVSGIASSREEARITVLGVPEGVRAAARVFGPLADANINVDMIALTLGPDGRSASVTFTVPRNELALTLHTLEGARRAIGFEAMEHDASVAKISVIGVGMRSHAGVASRMFKALAQKGIAVAAVSTSEVKISALIPEAYLELAVRSLHTAYGLDAAAT
ncbi:MAG: aspartate kinase [Alphaproteobacteria bacterium]|nr:aspartate kinase [Alphaproteobacteria bacterium]